ncbi:Nephrocystin-1 [Merluccius polli]|uniref:Nephrocystin-1 n=1 Tax=Merluccius polli TaxID=89951 RepID=A0AA47MRH6_MERPO|nr:Nephrocystin-1 [Merluccius polli]
MVTMLIMLVTMVTILVTMVTMLVTMETMLVTMLVTMSVTMETMLVTMLVTMSVTMVTMLGTMSVTMLVINDSQEEESEEEDEDIEDDEDDEEEDDAGVEHSQPFAYIVLSDIRGEEEGDLSVQQGELLRIIKRSADGWWLAEDRKGNQGVVPRTYLKGSGVRVEEDEDESEEESDEELMDSQSDSVSHWSKVRKALTEVTHRLTDLKQISSCCVRFKHSKTRATYRASRFILPELSQSQLAFKDIFMEPNTGEVRGRQVPVCVCFSLWACRMIAQPGVGVQVLSRHVRLCAFDGSQVLSNIHTVRATYNPKNPKTWTFSARVNGDLPTLLDGECFLRCSADSPELGLLLELGVTFTRTSTGETGELSCGWAFLKLTDTTARTYELPVHGGTPFESELPVQTESRSMFQQVLQNRKQPKLVVKLKSVNRRTRTQLSLLPDCLLYCSNVVHLLLLFRQTLTKTLMDRPTAQNTDLMCHPVLTSFPRLLDETDLLDALKSAWLHAEQAMSRTQKRDLLFLREQFTSVFLTSVYPLLHSPMLPCQRWADPPREQRAQLISKTLEAFRSHSQSESPVAQDAFDVLELTFDLLTEDKCISKPL